MQDSFGVPYQGSKRRLAPTIVSVLPGGPAFVDVFAGGCAVTLAALQQDGGGGLTRMEHLVLKAMDNHRKGKLSFRDLKDLSAILGEQTLNVKTDGPRLLVVDEETLQAAAERAAAERIQLSVRERRLIRSLNNANTVKL